MSVADPLLSSLLATGPFVRDAAPYRTVAVTGPDAGDFLQRLCSQDVLALPPGVAAPAAFLDAKGKLLVTCLVQRTSADRDAVYWLETQQHQHERLAQLLERYHFTERLAISAQGPVAATCREWVGPADTELPPRAGLWFAWARGGIAFVRQHGDGAAALLPPWRGAPLDAERAEALRMSAGIVQVGVETEAATLALEAGLADHCSTTKGCYTGQEIVARIHTYGHTNRALCLLDLAAGAPIAAPQPLHECDDRLAVGRVMRAVPVPGHAARRGLGYLPKDFQAPGTRLQLADGAPVTVVTAFR